MYKCRTIVIPEDADKIYTKEYIRKIASDRAKEAGKILKSHLIEKYGFEFND